MTRLVFLIRTAYIVTNPNKTGNDPDDALFQAYDEASGKVIDGIFLAGWARKASEGLGGDRQSAMGNGVPKWSTRYLGNRARQNVRADARGRTPNFADLLKERKSQPVDLEGLRVLGCRQKKHAPVTGRNRRVQVRREHDMLPHIELRETR